MIIMDIKKLREKSTEIKQPDEIIELLEEELKRHQLGIGLSAIQIGIPKRIAIVRTKVRGKLMGVNLVSSNIIVK